LEDGVVIGGTEKVNVAAFAINGGACGTAVDEVAFPSAGGAVPLVAFVAGRGEVERSTGGDTIDGLGDDAVLEGRFIKIADIVDDDVAAGRAEVEDVLKPVAKNSFEPGARS
jgi:hypothetical protein